MLLGVISVIVGGFLFLMVHRSTDSLRTLILRISEGVNQVASSAQQVSASSQALAQGASEQAASLGETAATEEITAMTLKNLDSTESVARLMVETESNVGRMTQAFDRMSDP